MEQENVLKQKSLTKSLTVATIIMMGSVLLSRIAGLLREQVLAYNGGTSSEMDAYVTAFLIPELLNHFLAGGFLSITFIPIFQKHMLDGNKERAWQSFSNLLTIGSVLFLILIPIMMFFSPSILGITGRLSSDPEKLALTCRLTLIILPAQIFFYWGAFFSAVQMAEHRFFLPALNPLFYNFGIIIGGLILSPFIGIEGFAWGVLIGAFTGNVLLQLPGALKAGLKYKFTINISDPDFICYVKKTIPLILGVSMVFSNELFFRFFGAYLPEGSTASINYALRTMLIVVAVFGQASGVAFFPFLSKMAIEKQFEKMSEMLHSMLLKIAIYLLPITGIMFILSKPIISILYQRGSFNETSVTKTAAIFSVYLFGAFFYSASMIISRSFYALQNTILPMFISTAIAIFSIPLYIISIKFFDAGGIAFAAVAGMFLQFLILYFCWINKYKIWKNALGFFNQFLKALAICISGSAAGFLLFNNIKSFTLCESSLLNNCFISTVVCLSTSLIIFAVYEFTGIQSMKATLRGLLKKK